MEGDPTPNEAPTRRLVLTDEDLDRISEAIREGVAKEPPDRSKLLREVLAVVVGFGVLFLLYLVLSNWWRPEVDLNVQASSLPATVLTHQHDDGVGWDLRTGQAQSLTVDELRAAEDQDDDRFTISLPIPRTDCFEVATAIDATCFAGMIDVQAGVTVAWSAPQVLRLERATTSDQVSSESDQPPQLRLTLERPSGNSEGATGEAMDEAGEESETAPDAPRRPQLTIADWHSVNQQWCFTYQTNAAATLSVSGGSGGYQRQFEPATAPDIDCGDGLRLRVTAGAATAPDPDDSQGDTATEAPDGETPQARDGSRRASSVVTLSGISSLDVATNSEHLVASALSGTLQVDEDVSVLDEATQAVLAGDSIDSVLEIQAGTPSLTITGKGVSDIETGSGNRVQTVWDRNPELILPIFLGLVGVLTPLLGSVYRNGIDYLARRNSPDRSKGH